MNPISDQIRQAFYKKFRIRFAQKNFQSTPHPLPEIFQSILDFIFRTISPENQKFCSMYIHFVG